MFYSQFILWSRRCLSFFAVLAIWVLRVYAGIVFGAINCSQTQPTLGESNVIWISELSVLVLPGIPQNLTFHAENWTAPELHETKGSLHVKA